MKVGWLIYGALEQTTGGYLYDRFIIEGLRTRGHDVEVLSGAPGPGDFWRIENLSGKQKGAPYDALVVDGLCIVDAAPLLSRRQLPVVLLVHHLTSWEAADAPPSLLAAEATALRESDFFVTTSEASRSRLLASAAWTEARAPGKQQERWVRSIEPGADRLLPWKPASSPSEAPYFVAVGSFIPRKRYHLLLDAWEQLAQPPQLELIGDPTRDPTEYASVQRRVLATPHLAKVVRLSGLLDDRALAQRLAGARALVLASALEGYGMVVSEALALGVPVLLSSDAAAPHRRPVNTESAWAVAPGILEFADAAELTRHLGSWTAGGSNALDHARQQLHSNQHALALPTWQTALSAWDELLHSLPPVTTA